jgi:hypothetical protein
MAYLSLSITGLDDLKRLTRLTNPDLYLKAIKGGISYASKAVPPVVSKGIRSRYGLTAARIKQDISGIRFDDGGTTATIRFSSRPPTLTQYGARPGTRATGQRGLGRGLGWSRPATPGKPVTALTLRSQGRRPVANAFMATGANGNQLVLRRSKARPGKFNAIYGPSIGSIFLGKSAAAEELQSDVQVRINEQFIKGFERVLSSAARGYGGRR